MASPARSVAAGRKTGSSPWASSGSAFGWLMDRRASRRSGCAVKLPKAEAAAGWGGDTLVSLDGPDGTWAIVWQTKWDSADDVGQFIKAATDAMADLPGAHVATAADVAGGLSNPALVLMARCRHPGCRPGGLGVSG